MTKRTQRNVLIREHLFEIIKELPWSTLGLLAEATGYSHADIRRNLRIMLADGDIREKRSYIHRGPPYVMYADVAHEGEPVP